MLLPKLIDVYLIGEKITLAGWMLSTVASGKNPMRICNYVDYASIVDPVLSGYNTANIRLIYPQFFPPPHLARVRFLVIFLLYS
jgi:hypothetical protein